MIRTAGIIGLGLIGGSLARDLAALGVRIHGWDCDPDTLRAALDGNVVAAPLDPARDDEADLDILVLAIPVRAAVAMLEAGAGPLRSAAAITDVSSTKASMSRAARSAGLHGRFVGAHPLAGDHRSGWTASRTGLFRSAAVYLCADGARAAAVETVRGMWESVGGVCEDMDAASHDRLLAWSSHMPQAASTAIARALEAADVAPDRLGPGGRDMTRLAGSSPDMWTDIALDNAESLRSAIDRVGRELAALGDALDRRDADAVRRYFTRDDVDRDAAARITDSPSA